jgi:hypothetical protein
VNNTGTKKGSKHYEINGILKRKKWRVCSMFKKSVRVFVEQIQKMGCVESSGVPVLYIGRRVPKG